MTSQYVQDSIAYAMTVTNGSRVAGKLEKLACQRFLDDLERDDLDFDTESADRVCRFAENLKHVKGKWANKRENIVLTSWQRFIYCNLFGFKRKGTDIRRFRSAYLECARKQGKTTFVVPLSHYMTFAEGEEGAETFFAATTERQAEIAYRMAVQMCRRDPEFKSYFGLETGKTADLPARVTQRSTGSFMQPTIGQGETLDGSSPHCAIVDELHAHPTSAVYDVLVSGMGSREQPLLIAITTAGFDQSGVCYSQRGFVKDILEGHVKEDSTFGIIYTIDDDDDWADENVWPKANPNLGVSINIDYLREQCAQAKAVPSKRNSFLTKHINRWTNASVAWMDMTKWRQCHVPGLKITDFSDWKAFVGVDMATKKDLAAVVILFEKDGQFAAFPEFFLPEDRANDPGHRNSGRYKGWAEEGLLHLTDGNVTDQEEIEDHIKWLCDSFDVKEVGYDPYEATNMAVRLLKEGIPMVEVAQNTRQMSEPAKRLEEITLQGKLMHDHSVLSWTISNCVAKEDVNENILVKKEKGQEEKKIDGAVATIIALNRWIADENETFVYDTQDIRFLQF